MNGLKETKGRNGYRKREFERKERGKLVIKSRRTEREKM